LDGLAIASEIGQLFIFNPKSQQSLNPIHLPVQWVWRIFTAVAKGLSYAADQLLQLVQVYVRLQQQLHPSNALLAYTRSLQRT